MCQAVLYAAALEVVQIGCIALNAVVLTGNKLCKLAVEGNKAGLCALDKWQLVDEVGEPLALLLPTDMEAPQRILQRFVAHADLCGERLLTQVHQSTAYSEVLVDFVIQIQTKHRFTLHAVVVITLYGGTDIGTGIKEALVDDCHTPHVVIDSVVGILCKCRTACGDNY